MLSITVQLLLSQLFVNEGLVGQNDRLEGLTRVLQAVASQSFNERRLLHVRDSAAAANDAHALGRGGGEGVKGRVGADGVGGLERAGMRLNGLRVSIEEEGPGGSWVDELFGVGGELAGHGGSEGVQRQREGLVLDQFWCRHGGGRAGVHPLRGWQNDAGASHRAGPTALLHFGGSEFSGGEAGSGEGHGLWAGRRKSGRWLLRGKVGNTAAGWRWGGDVGGVGPGVRGRAGAGVAKHPRAGLGGEGCGGAGQRGQEGRRYLAPHWNKHLSIWVKAHGLGLLSLSTSFTLSYHSLCSLTITAEAWRVLQVEHLHCPLLPNLIRNLIGVNPHAELCWHIRSNLLSVQAAPFGGQLHHRVPLGSQVDAAESRTSHRSFRVPVSLKPRHEYPLQLLSEQVSTAPRQLVVQVGHNEVEGDLNLQMHGCTGAVRGIRLGSWCRKC